MKNNAHKTDLLCLTSTTDWGTVHATGQQTNLAGEEGDGKASLEVKGQKESTREKILCSFSHSIPYFQATLR